MNTKIRILERLDETCRSIGLDDIGDIKWEDGQLLHRCVIRARRGDPSGWRDFMMHIKSHPNVGRAFVHFFQEFGWVDYSRKVDRWELTLPPDDLPIDDETREELLAFLNPGNEDEKPKAESLGTIMYIEEKPELTGHARIGRVSFSATGKTIYYAGRRLRSLKGGYKANYWDVDSGLEYWISNCKKDGNDTLYPGIVEIDEDAREEYWTTIRNMPDNVHLTKFRSEGKHAKRRPS